MTNQFSPSKYQQPQPGTAYSESMETIVGDAPKRIATPASETYQEDRDSSKDNDENTIKSMGSILHSAGYHPVLIFGATRAGKTMFLSSLFRYINTCPNSGATIDLGPPLIPTNGESDYPARIYKYAQELFLHTTDKLYRGAKPIPNRDADPFYVPVIFKARDDDSEVRIAFLESRGEWYLPQRNKTNLHQNPKEEVADVLRKYKDGISCISLAPYTVYDEGELLDSEVDNTQLLGECDLGLAGVLKKYQNFRRGKVCQDSHMFLLSKWDIKARPHLSFPKFSAPTAHDVVDICKEKFPRAWSTYTNLALGSSSGRRAFMQYCSEVLDDEGVMGENDPHTQLVLDRYARIIWDWIYRNATSGGIPNGKGLYDDLIPLPPQKTSLWTNVLNKIIK